MIAFLENIKIPSGPGVYFFKDENGRMLYIGKAINLKNRIGSYRKTTDYRLQKMLELAVKVGFKKTNSEIESLILESQLIKKYLPKFNIMLRDDKQYFYIVFTKEKFPKIIISHQPHGLPSEALAKEGPFTDGTALKTALRLLRRIFPYCTCKQAHINYCLNYHIGNCPGFCCLKEEVLSSKHKILSREVKQYKKNIKAIRDVLNGKHNSLIKSLKKELNKLGGEQKFEEAIALQHKIDALKKVFENALILNTSYLLLNSKTISKQQNVLEKLKQELKLDTLLPRRIEGYDMANIQGQYAVGSMVVFTNGQPDKSQYRKFKVRTVDGADDTAMLKEILTRRFNHPEWPYPDLIIVDGSKAQFGVAENIILNLKFKILKQIRIIALTKDEKHKGHHIYINTENHKLLAPSRSFTGRTENLSKLSPNVRNLILAVDAEAHRFAISYYRKLHRKEVR